MHMGFRVRRLVVRVGVVGFMVLLKFAVAQCDRNSFDLIIINYYFEGVLLSHDNIISQ